jgi:DnaK suppressor protein
MDDADISQAREQFERDIALRDLRDRIDWCEPQLKALDSSGNEIVICRECGDPLSPARLAAYPRATYCVPCKQDLELKERTT